MAASAAAWSQPTQLTLEQCYRKAEQYYPLSKKRGLIGKSREYSIENIVKGYLPQLTIHGRASYQSGVTRIPVEVPGLDIPELSKDQYKVYGEISQIVYDGGKIKAEKQREEAVSRTAAESLSVELYQLKERIHQLFFGILLADEQLRQNTLLQQDIALGIKNARALVANGVAFQSSVDILEAELLRARQQAIALTAGRKAYATMLELFIHVPVDQNTRLVKPVAFTLASPEIDRPELQLFQARLQELDTRHKMLQSRNLPKVNFFLQGGYGRPAFNLLSDSFDAYYIGGLRLTIPVSGLYTLKNDKALLGLQAEHIRTERETFLFNTRLALRQENEEIEKLKALLASDDRIIALRTGIKKAASSRLEHGVITVNDFLREVNAENNARQERALHEIQLLMAQYSLKYTSGNLNPQP